MKKHELTRIRHMLESAQLATEFARGKTEEDLAGDFSLQLKIARLLEIVGEAAKNVPSAIKESNKDIQWRKYAGLRDRLIHGYFDLDWKIIWGVVSIDLHILIDRLKQIVKEKS